MIQIELTELQAKVFLWAMFVGRFIFASLFFHWALKLGVKNISKKANWIATAVFFVIYSSLLFLFATLSGAYASSTFWQVALNALQAISTAGAVLAVTLLVWLLVHFISKKIKRMD